MDGKKPYIAILVIQSIYAGLTILSKAAFNGGMNTFIFMFYRQAIATVLLAPFAIAFERKTAPPMSFKMLTKIFILALLGITFCLNTFNIALNYTSAVVAMAATNVVPVVTFFLAVLLKMETINIRSLLGIAKVVGLTLCLAGILLTAFYKGPGLKPLNYQHPILHGSNNIHANHESENTWIKGTFLFVGAIVSSALWIVLQGQILKEYPSKLMFTTLISFFSTIQCFLVAVAFANNFAEWKLHFNDGLVAVIYTGVLVACIAYYLQAWCIQKKGPVFVAMSSPLALGITTAISPFLLGEITYLGSALGGTLMVGGLYSVLWAKNRELMHRIPSLEEGNGMQSEGAI